MADEDYTQDEYLMSEIEDARESSNGRDEVRNHGTDLHILIAGEADPRAVSLGLEYPNFVAFLNAKDDAGMTPLMLAAERLVGDIAMHLHRAGADVMLKNKKGQTAMDVFEKAYAEGAEELGSTPERQEDTAKWFRGFLKDEKEEARRANAKKLAMVAVGKQNVPHDLIRGPIAEYLGVKPKKGGRKTRARKTKRRITRRR